MVSYEKLFKKLKGYDRKEIKRFLGINDSTLTKLYYNQTLSPNLLKKISNKLNCKEQQIVTKKLEHDFVPVAQPFVKWVGGKRQLYNEIKKLIPKSYNNYIEPFVGGGAVLYLLHPKTAIINDYNYELITTYQQVANNLESLKKLLQRYEKQHAKYGQEFYLKIRELDKDPGLDKLSELEIAARFIYLNKAGFNGMYRVNKSGFCNVPWNKKEIINTFDEDNLNKLCNYFNENKIKMYNEDFEKIIEKAKPENFAINLMKLLDNDEKVIEIISLIHAIQYRDFTKKTGIDTKQNIRSAEIVTFCEETGLLSFLTTSKINDIYSYIAGCSVGLDSNARKNRSGKEMASIVLDLLSSDHNIEHIEQEISVDEIKERYNFDIKLSEKNKRFDFSFIYKNKLYLVEANQYKGGGSKINEVSRSYRKINDEIQKIKNVEFIWITDGRGWTSAKTDFTINCKEIKYFMVPQEIEEANGISNLL